jgi:hypothetical protein
MNVLVHPSAGFNNPLADTADSIDLIEVVPTEQTFFLAFIALLT